MLMSNSPDISIWKMDLSGRDMVTDERLDYAESGMEKAQLTRRIYWRLPFWRLLTATKPKNR
jgi:hypothetical protein